MTVGLLLPLDNDWSPSGERRRQKTGRPFGVPDLSEHADLARLADRLGFAALWIRDVPLYDPRFGDAGTVFDPWTYLGYLARLTRRAALGTAAIALPLHHPLHAAKAAASVDQLSGGRLILGLASGDRPVEYPVFGRDFETRGAQLRESVAVLRTAWRRRGAAVRVDGREIEGGLDVLPKPAQDNIPLVMTGYGRQTPEWIAENLDGWFDYHRPPSIMAEKIREWRSLTSPESEDGTPEKPFINGYMPNLTPDPDTRPRPHKFGATLGRNPFLEQLKTAERIGVDHMAIEPRRSERPIAEVLEELAEHILPAFPTPREPDAHGTYHHP